MTSDANDFEHIKKWFEENKRKHDGACPNCGYCPHCGRGRQDVAPVYPVYPYYPQPWWAPYPYQPVWISSPTYTIASDAPATTGSAAIGWVDL